MTAPRTTVEISRETALEAFAVLIYKRKQVETPRLHKDETAKAIVENLDAAIADLERALGEKA